MNMPVIACSHHAFLSVCPGRWLALDTIWITIASVLAVYNVSKPKDANGVVMEQPVEFTGVSIRCVSSSLDNISSSISAPIQSTKAV